MQKRTGIVFHFIDICLILFGTFEVKRLKSSLKTNKEAQELQAIPGSSLVLSPPHAFHQVRHKTQLVCLNVLAWR